MFNENFDPFNPKYKKVEDLPKEEQANFVNSEDGFIRKEAQKEITEAEKIIELANQFKEAGISAEDIFKKKTKSRMLREIGQALKDEKSAMDILRERAAEEELKPVDLLQEEARKTYAKQHPEETYLNRLKSNPDVLTGIPRRMWENKNFVLGAVKLNGKAFRKARHGLWGDEEIALEAVKHDGLALQYASESLRDNKDVVLEAVKQNPSAIRFASKDIKEAVRKILEG